MEQENPKIIYKYRGWKDEHHKNVLFKNELYLTSPKEFNDPFDSRFFISFQLIDSTEKQEKYISIYRKKYAEIIVQSGLNLERELNNLKEELQNPEQYYKRRLELEEPDWDLRNGILSMSFRWDSILMWSHYGDHHKGYCIGFNESKMRNSGIFGTGGSVEYTFDFPLIDPLKNEDLMKITYKRLFYKSEEWAYEKEYRLTKFYYPDLPDENDRVVYVPDDFISEVIIGLNISQESKEEIVNECKKRNIKIFQCLKVPNKYELQRIEI